MSGGKGGSTSTSVEIPEYIEEAARRNLAKAEGISQIGYVPYFGPDVAAFTPFQRAGFQQTADVASAFGLGTPTTQADIMGGMPEPTEFAGGVRGYSAAPLYQQAVDELAAQRPAQAQYIESFFIDPVTGQAGTRVQPAVDYSTMGTIADIRAADRANELAIAQAQAAAGPQNVTFETTSFAANPNLAVQPNDQIFNIAPPEVQIAQQIMATDPTNPDYNEAFQTVYDYQAAQAAQDPTGQSTGFGITPEIIDAAGVDAFLPPTVPSDYTLDPAISSAIDEIGYTPIEGRTLAEGEQAILELAPQEYTGFIDMIDGGGPNAAGGPFEGGGLLSDIGNFVMGGGIAGAAIGALEEALGIGQAAPSAPAIDPNKKTIRYTPLGDGTSSYQLFDAAGNLQQSGNQAGDISTMFGADTASKYNIVEEAPATPPSPADTGSSDVNAIMESILGPAVSVDDPMFAGGAAGFVDPDLPAPIIVPQRDDSFRNEPISFAPTTGRAAIAPPSKPARRFGGGGK